MMAWNSEERDDTWDWLGQASRYGLRGAEAVCIALVVASDDDVEGDEEVAQVLNELPKEVLVRVLQAMSNHKSKRGGGRAPRKGGAK